MTDSIELPPRVVLWGQAIQPLCDSLSHALQQPASPSGETFQGLEDVSRHFEIYTRGLADLGEMLTTINTSVLGNEQASDADVYRTAGRLEQALQQLIRPYREIGSCAPLPDFPELQPLILGVFRHTLSEIHDWLQRMVEDIQDPASACERRALQVTEGMVLSIDLNLTSPPEMERLQQIADSLRSAAEEAAEDLSIPPPTSTTSAPRPGLLAQARQAPQNWRDLLWQFMVSTPFDFGGFDRRFIHRKLYLEETVGESVEVAICIDTSASIGKDELGQFMAEIQSILDAYPQIKGTLFYADADLYGPHAFGADAAMPEVKGGGGTSFKPFFQWVERENAHGNRPVCIYFTDGYGDFPSSAPESPVLWLVLPGGLVSSGYPFGDVVRMGTGSV